MLKQLLASGAIVASSFAVGNTPSALAHSGGWKVQVALGGASQTLNGCYTRVSMLRSYYQSIGHRFWTVTACSVKSGCSPYCVAIANGRWNHCTVPGCSGWLMDPDETDRLMEVVIEEPLHP